MREEKMVLYKILQGIETILVNGSNEYMTYRQLRKILMEETGVHHDTTIKHYLKIMQKDGVIKSDMHDGCPMFKIIKK